MSALPETPNRDHWPIYEGIAMEQENTIQGLLPGAVIEINGYEIKELIQVSLHYHGGDVCIRAEQPLRTASPGFREAWKCLNAKKMVKLRLIVHDCVVSGTFKVEESGEIYTNLGAGDGEYLFWTNYAFSAPRQNVKFSWESW